MWVLSPVRRWERERVGGPAGGKAEVGCAAPRLPVSVAWLLKMDLELLGNGVEKDGKEPRGMEKRTGSLPVPGGIEVCLEAWRER